MIRLKTLWRKGENDDLHNTFKKASFLGLLTLQPIPKQALVFTCLQNKPFENNVGKGEIAHNEQFGRGLTHNPDF